MDENVVLVFLQHRIVIMATLSGCFDISFADEKIILIKQSMEQEKNNDLLQMRPYEQSVGNSAAGAAQPADVQTEQPYEQLNDGLKSLFGEDFDINDKVSQELLLEQLFVNREQNERLAEMLQRDPRLAQMLADMVDGKRNAHSALARYFGSALMNYDEDSSEYEEMLQADEERRAEMMRAAEDRREYERNLDASYETIEAFCKERGYDVSDFMNDIWERVAFPILTGRYSRDVCVALEHAMNYDKDVESAFAAGDIKGRNTNIQRMKEDSGDGLPKGMVSVAPENDSVKRRGNSLIREALNA